MSSCRRVRLDCVGTEASGRRGPAASVRPASACGSRARRVLKMQVEWAESSPNLRRSFLTKSRSTCVSAPFRSMPRALAAQAVGKAPFRDAGREFGPGAAPEASRAQALGEAGPPEPGGGWKGPAAAAVEWPMAHLSEREEVVARPDLLAASLVWDQGPRRSARSCRDDRRHACRRGHDDDARPCASTRGETRLMHAWPCAVDRPSTGPSSSQTMRRRSKGSSKPLG